jgi:hypothetical protein
MGSIEAIDLGARRTSAIVVEPLSSRRRRTGAAIPWPRRCAAGAVGSRAANAAAHLAFGSPPPKRWTTAAGGPARLPRSNAAPGRKVTTRITHPASAPEAASGVTEMARNIGGESIRGQFRRGRAYRSDRLLRSQGVAPPVHTDTVRCVRVLHHRVGDALRAATQQWLRREREFRRVRNRRSGLRWPVAGATRLCSPRADPVRWRDDLQGHHGQMSVRVNGWWCRASAGWVTSPCSMRGRWAYAW